MINAWFFAAPKVCTRLPNSEPTLYTCAAAGVDPTKLTAWTRGSRNKISLSWRSPCTTLNTPSGKPASFNSSAKRIDKEGSALAGFKMKVLPQANAIGNIHIGTMAGKLNGVIPTVTPSGCKDEWISMPRPACSENSPFNKWGIPHENSTTSKPRVNSPQASE